MNQQIDESVALVVGGASGIGEAAVESLVSHGHRVVIGDLNVDAAQSVAMRLAEDGHEVRFVRIDVTDTESVDRALAESANFWGRLDVLVPCAGVIDPSPSAELTDASLLGMLDIHLLGSVRCIRAAYPFLRQSRSGSIVAVSSVAAHIGVPHRLSYAAAKGGIEAIVRTLAVEWASEGIRVNAVAPGWVKTPMIRHAVEEGRLDVTTLEQLSPFERMAEPFEVADTVAFLASAGAGFITGTTVLVDGALSIRGPWPQGARPARGTDA